MLREASVVLICLVLLLGVLTGVEGFVPSTIQRKTPSFGLPTRLADSSEDFPGFEDVDLEQVLGTLKFKKLKRKLKRKKNQAIRDAEAEAIKDANRAAHDARTRANLESKIEKLKKKALKLIISGAPASGKGTQCAIIKEKFGVVHLSTGDMLRAAVAAETEVGKTAKSYMDGGKLVPDEVIIGVVKDRLAEEDCASNGWLLDGFPRTQEQAKALEEAGIYADCFIMLNVPDDDLIERVVGRRSDPVTGEIYHMTFKPPPEDEEIRGRLEQRSDDTEEKARVRLEQFHTNVDAVKGSYTKICVEIDGTLTPDDVSEKVAKAITSKVKK